MPGSGGTHSGVRKLCTPGISQAAETAERGMRAAARLSTAVAGSHEGAAGAGAGHRQSLPAVQRHSDQHHRRRHPHCLRRRRRHLHPHCRCHRRLHLHHRYRSPHSRHHPHLHPHTLHRLHRHHRRPRHPLQHPCPPCSCRCGASH
ncbi:unnamed protein product [Closterium sp. NIES-53]